ncbi:NAD(P)H-binding protein [Aquincola sp. J276]|uniref:NAD(P)H-binding protein n=1 Tax=Aquincola sp. J276 TaxID=2898432 RepID=UPI0021519507|nr:NAD(P)H-binding protein [Aquincola sp. J276]MCR5868303.1 NAD(P)H-binding protein [Aquincola sp. J276]
MKLLLLGATGLVGRLLLEQALADARVRQVTAPVRRAGALPAQPPRLLCPVVDFQRLPEDADWWRADAVVCTLGTTLKAAGSREAFRQVDHGHVLQAAQLARRHGTPAFVLTSATGADAGSRLFYNRVKGEVERDLEALGFASLTLVRPGLIGGARTESRPAERLSQQVLGLLGPLLPRAWRISPAPAIARALLRSALQPAPGVQVVPADALAG